MQVNCGGLDAVQYGMVFCTSKKYHTGIPHFTLRNISVRIFFRTVTLYLSIPIVLLNFYFYVIANVC